MDRLTETERADLRDLIEDELKQIRESEASSAEDTRPIQLDQQSVGRLSRMDSLQQQAMSKATAARRQQRRRLLEATLKRLGEDEFGHCIECGSPIGMARLKFNPTLVLCRSCMSDA